MATGRDAKGRIKKGFKLTRGGRVVKRATRKPKRARKTRKRRR